MESDRYRNLEILLIATFGLVIFSGIIWLQWSELRPMADDPTLLGWAETNRHPSSDWGPLYVLALRMAYLASGDTLTGFKIVISGVSLTSSVLIFFWIQKCTESNRFAAGVALYYLVSGFSPAASSTHQSDLLIESSLAGHMALCFVLLALLASPSFKSPLSLALCADSLLLATYCRPEFFMASALCIGAAVVSVGRRPIAASNMIWIASLASVWVGLVYVWGAPLPSARRAFIAFGQHAGLSFCTAYNAFCVTNLWMDWESYVNKLFPGATSIWTALQVNPLAFGEHLVRNVALSIINAVSALLNFAGLPAYTGMRTLVAAVFVLWCGIELGMRSLRAGRPKLPIAKLNETLLAVAVTVIIFQLMNWILLYPRAHYMIVPVVVGLGLVKNLSKTWREYRSPLSGKVKSFDGIGVAPKN